MTVNKLRKEEEESSARLYSIRDRHSSGDMWALSLYPALVSLWKTPNIEHEQAQISVDLETKRQNITGQKLPAWAWSAGLGTPFHGPLILIRPSVRNGIQWLLETPGFMCTVIFSCMFRFFRSQLF